MNLKFTLTIVMIFINLNIAFSQGKISVSSNGTDTYIETYKKSFYGDEVSLAAAYRLGPGALNTLKQGIKKSLEWSKLNETHQKKFEKEVCRFKVMDKEQFKFHGYVDQFSTEMTLLFKGNDNGLFELIIKPYNSIYQNFIEFNDREMVKKFNDLLLGKSANREIDDLFN